MRTSQEGGRDVIIEEWYGKQESDYEIRKERIDGEDENFLYLQKRRPRPLPFFTFTLE